MGTTSGSSPLTRGKPWSPKSRRAGRGIIPAHAGKTLASLNLAPAWWDHPRSRGENSDHCAPTLRVLGSSPLTRGKRGEDAPALITQGIIPAHAGKTTCPPIRWWSPPDHPRSRGENISSTLSTSPPGGSSPLTRGKQREKVGRPPDRGIIPAHAGKTQASRTALHATWDHPRSRGENLLLGTPTPVALGSSPLTRGKLEAFFVERAPLGIIPAHAGKTCS